MKDLLPRSKKINNPLERLGIDSFKNLTLDIDALTRQLLNYQSLFYPTTEAIELK